MTVAHLCFNQEIHRITTNPFTNEKDDLDHSDIGYMQLFRAAILCNKAVFLANQEDKPILKRGTVGDASESAIFKYTERNAQHVLGIESAHEVSSSATGLVVDSGWWTGWIRFDRASKTSYCCGDPIQLDKQVPSFCTREAGRWLSFGDERGT